MVLANGDKTADAFLGWFLFLWGLFTFFMWIGTFSRNRAIQFVFLSLTVLFLLLAIRDWSGSALVGQIAGWERILCGLSAIYLAMAEVINEVRGRTVLPIGDIRHPKPM
jgi:succinate-acetate transporter protein